MSLWQIILEYLKVFLSWPPVVGLTIIIALILFRYEIRDLLNTMVEVRGPGDFSAFFEGFEENVNIDDLLEKYPKWRELISHIIEDYRTFKKHGTLKHVAESSGESLPKPEKREE